MDQLITWLVQHVWQLAGLLPFVAIEVPSAAEIADKWARVTSGRQQDYQQGVGRTNPANFEAAAVAAAPTWQAGVNQAAAENRFATGLAGAGARWKRKIDAVGASRFGTGVTAAKEDMNAGVGPYVDALRGITLPPRGPRGDPGNNNRVDLVTSTLNQTRRQRGR